MLGEIIKSTEALRYHAKSAEIAGQNLAHVNDESYARQRVVSREGLMSKGQGGLNVGSLETAGIEHFRNELLDKRVLSEFSESAYLEAQSEILLLLQAALGESIDRKSIDGSLNGDNDSNLAAGGLARAMDDLFNSFHELSASPDEATAKAEIINKVKTLTKRFNDAGGAIDEIDSDISASVESSVHSVNNLLEQIHELNVQIKRFELLGQGRAVTYRDNRQKLLEDLSKLINFKVIPEVDADSQQETGFWNITTLDHQNQVVDLVSSTQGVSPLSKDFGKLITLEHTEGSNAQVKAKIAADGTLGHIEVLDGGSQYDDTKGPILFAITPPTVNSTNENNSGLSEVAYQKGEVFSQGGKLYQALSDALAGVNLSDEAKFLEITNIPTNGAVFPESFRKFSDLENFDKGDQIYYEGKLYQATESIGPFAELQVSESDQLTRKLTKGEVVLFGDQFFQVAKNLDTGSVVNSLALQEASFGEEINGLVSLGDTPPQSISDLSYVPSSVDADRPDRWFLTKSYQIGDVVKFKDRYLEFTQDVLRGTEIDELAKAMQAVAYNQERSYSAGDFIELNGDFYQFIGDVGAFADEAVVAANLSEVIGSDVLPFDGKIKFIENPNSKFEETEKSLGSIGLVTSTAQEINFKKQEDPIIFHQNDIFYYSGDGGEINHFIVTNATGEIDPTDFDPTDVRWDNHFKTFSPKLVNKGDPSLIYSKSFPVGHNLQNGSLIELNIGLAEAVVKKGEITGFNILNKGNGLPGMDSVFAGGKELLFDSGSIKGLQDVRSLHLEKFRTDLNDLVSSFVEEINSIYNPDDKPGSYMFGFDAVLTRPVRGPNLLMEEEYGYYGREGDASITLYRDEVDMTLPFASSESFSIVNTTPIFPEEFAGETSFYRGGDLAETTFRANDAGDLISFYGSASKMQYVTMENDDLYPGSDLIVGTEDDGRSLMMAYETIPFRVEGLEPGAKLPIIGDNFSFSALPLNPWNLAQSLKVDNRFNLDSFLSGVSAESGSNEIALAIAEMSDSNYIEKIAVMNADMGNTIADLEDNIEHQKSIETLLLDQRRAVSSVSIDEEVADLMRFQRSFQASSRVLSTLDKMLEIIVMGLVR
jgi:flagellar hook-associated protein FlgK